MEIKVKSIAPWFGGKRTLAPVIVEELGQHRAYWELCAGGMAVLLTKQACSMETVVDLHGDLTNLGGIIRDPILGTRFYRRVRRLLFSEEELAQANHVMDTTPEPTAELNLERAIAFFCMSWMMRSGIAGTDLRKRGAGRCICVRYTCNGGAPVVRWNSAISSIPAWRQRLRNVLILRRDAMAVAAKIDDQVGTAIYADPTYLAQTRSGLTGSGAKSQYRYEFSDNGGEGLLPDDHQRLADELRRFKNARVVVSYYDHPRLQTLYPGWTIRKFDVAKSMSHQSRRGKNGARATEVLIINGPSYLDGATPPAP